MKNKLNKKTLKKKHTTYSLYIYNTEEEKLAY